MRDDVYASILVEAWIIGTPQLVDAVRLFDDGSNHLGLMVGEVIWNVQHDIGDNVSNRR